MITIPEKHFVGLRETAGNNVPLGFATPYGTDAAALKRQATVVSWADNSSPPIILDNTLMTGFKIAQSIRRHSSWGKGNVVWRIEDPRGFELEISSPNFAAIVDCCTITNGVIEGACVWGREGANNVLLPEASEPYQAAVRQTVRKNSKKIGVSSINPGALVRLVDGSEVLFLGTYHILCSEFDCTEGFRYGYGHNPHHRRINHASFTVGATKKRHLYVLPDDVNGVIGGGDYASLCVPVPYASNSSYCSTLIGSASNLAIVEVLDQQATFIDPNLIVGAVNQFLADRVRSTKFAGVDNALGISAVPFGPIGFRKEPTTDCTYRFHGSYGVEMRGKSKLIYCLNSREQYITGWQADISIQLDDWLLEPPGTKVDVTQFVKGVSAWHLEDVTGYFKLMVTTSVGDFPVRL